MKKGLPIFFIALLLTANAYKAQTNSSQLKTEFIKSKDYFSASAFGDSHNYGDSLRGFDEKTLIHELSAKNVFGQELFNYLKICKRNYIKKKYKTEVPATVNINMAPAYQPKPLGNSSQVNIAPCVNEDFESSSVGAYTLANSITGWTLSNNYNSGCSNYTWIPGATEFSIIATPVTNVPGIGTLLHSPLGGTKVAQLNNFVNNASRNRLSSTFPVTSSNNQFQFAVAGVYENVGHACCDESGFNFRVLNCNSQVLSCYDYTVNSSCNTSSLVISQNSNYTVLNWQIRSIDLTPFIGSCVTVEAWSSDCSFFGHFGTTYFDAKCGSQYIQSNLTPVSNSLVITPVSLCPGTNTTVLNGPQGYSSYLWLAPSNAPSISPSQATLSSLGVAISSINTTYVYTVQLSTSTNCTFQSTYSVSSTGTTQVSILATGSSPSCAQGNNGAATVQAIGSNVGYTFSWLNSTNSVVSTASAATGLIPGVYTVSIAALNNSLCGTASTTVQVNTNTQVPVSFLNKNYCGGIAYFPSHSGSNFKWYIGNSAVSGTTGTAPAFSVNATGNPTIRLGRTLQGCRDSIVYNLVSNSSPTVSLVSTATGCPGSNSGTTIFSITPVGSPQTPSNSYTIVSLNSASSFSTMLLNSSSNSHTVTGLPVAQTLSISIFDGSCFSGASFAINGIVPAFNYTPAASHATVCSGSSGQLYTNFALPPANGHYSYSWSPSLFITSASTFSAITLSPTTSAGNASTLIYTVVVTPTAAYCPLTKTIALTVVNPATPSITPVQPLCNTSGQQTVLVSPVNGTFASGGSFINATTGVITPSLLSPGNYTFSYSTSVGNCVASSSSSFIVYSTPVMSITGNSSICLGESATLTASGASSYSWSSGVQNPVFVASPTVATAYVVTGTNNPGGCTSLKTFTVDVKPLPQLQLSGTFTICANETASMNVSGADSYTWSNGALGSSQIFGPTTTEQMTVTGTSAATGCKNSLVFTIEVDLCTGINEKAWNASQVKVYPNPVNAHLNLDAGIATTITVYSALGQIIMEKELSKGPNIISTTSWNKGVYVIKLEYSGKNELLRIIKE